MNTDMILDPRRELKRVQRRNLWIWRGNAAIDVGAGIALFMHGMLLGGVIFMLAAVPALFMVGLMKKELKR